MLFAETVLEESQHWTYVEL